MSLSQGLPTKAPDPAETLFGRRGGGDHNHNHAAASGTTPSSSRKKGGSGSELAFLDYLACSIWCVALISCALALISSAHFGSDAAGLGDVMVLMVRQLPPVSKQEPPAQLLDDGVRPYPVRRPGS
jgi:hypothetical protein